jgi:hypothetical protein
MNFMKKYLVMLSMLFITIAYAAEKGTWTGYISDANCGVKEDQAGHAECAKKCVKGGAAPVFVIGDKVYTITNPKKVADFIGDKVEITGTITDNSITVDKISK